MTETERLIANTSWWFAAGLSFFIIGVCAFIGHPWTYGMAFIMSAGCVITGGCYLRRLSR